MRLISRSSPGNSPEIIVILFFFLFFFFFTQRMRVKVSGGRSSADVGGFESRGCKTLWCIYALIHSGSCSVQPRRDHGRSATSKITGKITPLRRLLKEYTLQIHDESVPVIIRPSARSSNSNSPPSATHIPAPPTASRSRSRSHQPRVKSPARPRYSSSVLINRG